MNTLETTHCCPECQATLVDDIQNGERICSGCGVVVAEQMTDYGPESASNNPEEKMRLARATGNTTFAQHDLGIATEISISHKDFSGKSISSEVASQIHKIQKQHQRVRVLTPRERRLASVLSRISESCHGLSLPRNVLETASMIYRGLDKHMEVKGKSIASISAATIYMACKQCDVVRSMEEITGSMCPPKDVRAKSKLAAKYYRTMVMEMGQVTAPIVGLDRYISKIANTTHTDARVERLALELAEKTKDSRIADGKAPNGIAAAYLYVSSIFLGQHALQRDIAGVSGVSEVTIRNRCKEILASCKLRVVLRPSLARK